ncbi:hypothetical protein [Lachnoanaerobaculum sp. ICM7]
MFGGINVYSTVRCRCSGNTLGSNGAWGIYYL